MTDHSERRHERLARERDEERVVLRLVLLRGGLVFFMPSLNHFDSRPVPRRLGERRVRHDPDRYHLGHVASLRGEPILSCRLLEQRAPAEHMADLARKRFVAGVGKVDAVTIR